MKLSSFLIKSEPKNNRRSLDTKRIRSTQKQLALSVSKQNLPKAINLQKSMIPEYLISPRPQMTENRSETIHKPLFRREGGTPYMNSLDCFRTLANNISGNSRNIPISARRYKNNPDNNCDSNTPSNPLNSKLIDEKKNTTSSMYSISKCILQTEINDPLDAINIKDNIENVTEIKRFESLVPNIEKYNHDNSQKTQSKTQIDSKDKQYLGFEHLKHSLSVPKHSVTLKNISYALLQKLASVHSQNHVHCNLTTDNILFNNQFEIKLNLSLRKKTEISISRYSAPELVLDCPYNSSVDMWSFGCILAELFLGKPLFNGGKQKKILKSIMKCLGRPPYTLLRLGAKTNQFFNQYHGLFVPRTKQNIPYSSQLSKIKKIKDIPYLVDLLELCLNFNPTCRISAKEALLHPFFSTCASMPTLKGKNSLKY